MRSIGGRHGERSTVRPPRIAISASCARSCAPAEIDLRLVSGFLQAEPVEKILGNPQRELPLARGASSSPRTTARANISGVSSGFSERSISSSRSVSRRLQSVIDCLEECFLLTIRRFSRGHDSNLLGFGMHGTFAGGLRSLTSRPPSLRCDTLGRDGSDFRDGYVPAGTEQPSL